jgi:hypothetical protein
MSLTKTIRRRAPIDGSWFKTTANLDNLLRIAAIHEGKWQEEDMKWPVITGKLHVPVWIRMHLYEGGKCKENPTGMLYGPVVKIGTVDAPELEFYGHHHNAGLEYDSDIDGFDYPRKWLYRPASDDPNSLGEDASYYWCDKCKNRLYRDDLGRRYNNSACIFVGGLVCRDCEVTGLIYDSEVEKQIVRCNKLASFLGEKHRQQFERQIDQVGGKTFFGMPSQTRLYREDKFSFGWSTFYFTPSGSKEQGMNGGLIKHGPSVIEKPDGGYEFRLYDYKEKCEREATSAEVGNISWGIHT